MTDQETQAKLSHIRGEVKRLVQERFDPKPGGVVEVHTTGPAPKGEHMGMMFGVGVRTRTPDGEIWRHGFQIHADRLQSVDDAMLSDLVSKMAQGWSRSAA